MSYSGALSNREILVLEDSRISRNTINRIILEEDGILHSYADLKEKDTMIAEYYDIAIMDLMVGESNTLHLIPALKERNPSMRILVVTAMIDLLRENPETSECIDFLLEKPFTEEKLKKTIIEAVYHPLAGKNVLIIEDANISLKVMSRIVHNLGGTAFAYDDIPSDNELYRNNYDLALLDLVMPEDRNTVSLIPELRKKYPNIYIFVVTAMPALLHSHPEVMPEIAYIINKPFSDRQLEKYLIQTLDQPFADRRQSPRKKGIARCWVAPFDKEHNRPDLFESPYLVDLSNHGLSFQTYLQYHEDDDVIVWISYRKPHQGEVIIELYGTIRWITKADTDKVNYKKCGVEFIKENSKDYLELQEAVTRLVDI